MIEIYKIIHFLINVYAFLSFLHYFTVLYINYTKLLLKRANWVKILKKNNKISLDNLLFISIVSFYLY